MLNSNMNPFDKSRKKCTACETVRAVVRKVLQPVIKERSARNPPADPIPTSNKKR